MLAYRGPVIDAHHHLWHATPGAYPWLDGRAELWRDFTARDYASTFAGQDITATVLIEALAADPEAELTAATVERLASGGRIATALVGHAPLDAPDITARLDRLAARSPALRGIRDIVSAGAGRPSPARNPDLLERPGFRRGLAALAARGLVFDLMLRPHQMQDAARLLETLPELSVAIEHAADPWDQSPEGLRAWAVGLGALAEMPGCVLKVSALQCHDPGWTTDSLRRLLDVMLDSFGPARLAWGSDWPVHDLACPGPVALDAMREVTADWPAEAQAAFFAGTAARLYGIAVDPGSRHP